MEGVEKEVLLPDWHCYFCDTRIAQCSIGYSDPTGEPQCSRCGRFGFLEPLDASETAPVPAESENSNSNNNNNPSFLTAEISAVAVPFELSVTHSLRDCDGFRITLDGCEMPLRQERSPVEALDPSQRLETQILAFDVSRPMLSVDGLESFDELTANSIYQEFFGLDNNSESRATWMQAVADLPRKVLSEVSIEGPCAICQEDFKLGDTVTPLAPEPCQCAHTFHSSCIIPWLREHNSCPVCRYELPADLEEYERRKKEAPNSYGRCSAALCSQQSSSSR